MKEFMGAVGVAVALYVVYFIVDKYRKAKDTKLKGGNGGRPDKPGENEED